MKKDYRDNEYIDVFIDKWNDTYMHNKLNIIEDHNKVRDRITYIIDNFDKINSKDYKSEDEEIILKFLKDFFNDFNEIDSIKNIGVNKKLELCKDYYNEFKRLPNRSDVYKDFKIGLFVDHFKRGCNSHLKEEVENIFNTKIEAKHIDLKDDNEKIELCKEFYNEYKRLPKDKEKYKDFNIGYFIYGLKQGKNSHLKEEVENIFNTKI